MFITHKLNEIKAVADRCTVLRKGKCVGTVDVKDTTVDALAEMMVGRKVNFKVDKKPAKPKDIIMRVNNLSLVQRPPAESISCIAFPSTCARAKLSGIAGIEGNGQSELVYALTGLHETDPWLHYLRRARYHQATPSGARNDLGIAHIPEDSHRYGLMLDYTLAENLILKSYYTPEFNNRGFLRFDRGQKARRYDLIKEFRYPGRTGSGNARPKHERRQPAKSHYRTGGIPILPIC